MLTLHQNLYIHQTVWHHLVNDFLTNRMAHAYIFAGPNGIGKKRTATELIKYLIKADERVCERIDDGNFLDLLIIDKQDKSEIGIEQIRHAMDFFSHTPIESRYKFVIIHNADELNLNAANALLKTLEEPTKNTYLFLITNSPCKLLKTICSRCRIIRFRPLGLEEMQFSKNNTRELFLMEDFIAGSLDRAFNFNEYNILEIYNSILQLLQKDDILEYNKFCERINKNHHAWKLTISLIEYFLSRCIKFYTHCLDLQYMQELEKNLIPSIVRTRNLASWFQTYDNFLHKVRQLDIFNLDKKQFILLSLEQIKENLTV